MNQCLLLFFKSVYIISGIRSRTTFFDFSRIISELFPEIFAEKPPTFLKGFFLRPSHGLLQDLLGILSWILAVIPPEFCLGGLPEIFPFSPFFHQRFFQELPPRFVRINDSQLHSHKTSNTSDHYEPVRPTRPGLIRRPQFSLFLF